jgi:hypothetical protein
MEEWIIPIAIANLITEQKISRNYINNWFKPENYLRFRSWKRWIYDGLSCWSCLTVWVSVIYLIINGEPLGLQYIKVPLINMLVVDIIQKLKR